MTFDQCRDIDNSIFDLISTARRKGVNETYVECMWSVCDGLNTWYMFTDTDFNANTSKDKASWQQSPQF